jgi:hypothetical protein
LQTDKKQNALKRQKSQDSEINDNIIEPSDEFSMSAVDKLIKMHKINL